jgi:aquaglyceroporin related protein
MLEERRKEEGHSEGTGGSNDSNRQSTWCRIRHAFREPFSEFWGVFVLIMFGDGSVAQVVLSSGKRGDYQSISWGWG